MDENANSGNWSGTLTACALLLLGILFLAPVAAAAQEYDLFAPIPPAETPTDFETALKADGILKQDQTLADLPPAQQAAVRALANAETNPSMATSVALLAHFETFSADKADGFRLALIRAAQPVFLMADLAKYELVIQTNRRIQTSEASLGGGRGIDVSLRVGSTGARFAMLQQWVAAGRPMTGTWTYKDPFEPDRSVTFTGIPTDPAFQDAKLFKTDDDITNWATAAMRASDPLANEAVNGTRAAREFADITAAILADLPDAMKADLPGGRVRVGPEVMKVEFLSPTQAVNIMADKTLRQRRGWNAPIDLTGKVSFLGAWILSDPEKYNGLYAEEQLHAWGMAKGYVSENPLRPLDPATTRTYAASATGGKLKDIVGSDVFPKGVRDPFGWMATNYRQIFVTHEGDLDSVAKYTLRMIDWWENVNLGKDALAQLARDTPGIDAATLGNIAGLEQLANDIRNAKSAADKERAIAAHGGPETALADLKGLNQLMLLTGQRKHLEQKATALTRILQQDVAGRTLEERLANPLTFETILDEADRRAGAGSGTDDPYVAFRTSVNAYANGYANLPEEVAKTLSADIAAFVERDLSLPEGSGRISAELRLALLPVLRDSAMRAREVGGDLRADAAGLNEFATLAKSSLAKAIDTQLAALGEPDLHGYLRKLQQGRITRRQVRLLPDTPGGWPKVQVVDEIWRPADVAADLRRIMWLGENLGWSDATFARRLAAYFNGPDYRAPAADGTRPVGARSYADDAMDGFLGLTRLFDGVASTTRFVEMQGPDGETITRQLRGSRFADPALNLGLIAFEHTLRGSQALEKMWGLKGDVDSLTTFAKTLHALTVASPDMDRAAKAKMLATLAAESYGSFTSLVEKFGSGEWQGWMERNMGQRSAVLGKAGGTVGALLSTADDAFQSPESQQALFGAMVTDLLVAWQPEVATVLALHSMYGAGKRYFVTRGAKSDLIDLLAKNGEWEFPADGSGPRLLRVHLGNLIIGDDAAARAEQCKARAISSLAPKGKPNAGAVGIQELVRILPAIPKAGVPLCATLENGKCSPDSARLVNPRAAALTLFDNSPVKSGDPILRALSDSISARVGWEYFDALRQMVSFDDGSQWTAERLISHNIYPPTPEDSTYVLRQPIEVASAPADLADRPRDADTQWIHAGIWRDLNAGGRKMLGYTASEYWVRRQYLMECTMLDPWIKEAGRQAQKNGFKGIEIGDVADRLAAFDERIRKLDARFWPNIAASHQPYPIDSATPEYPADQKLAIYDHYLGASSNLRIDLRDLIKWFEGPQKLDDLPMGVVARGWARQYPGVLADTDSYQAFFARLHLDEERGRAFTDKLLQWRLENLLADMADMVARYEDGFDAALRRISAIRKYVAAADGYDIAPVHVAVLPLDSYAPPNGKYGPVADHLFPKGAWRGPGHMGGTADKDLLSGLNVTNFSFAADGSVGAALREWENGYKQVLATNRAALAEVMTAFQTTLVDEKQSGASVVFDDTTAGFEEMLATPAEDLARLHPLYPRLLRQGFQKHKISLAERHKDRMFDKERQTILSALRREGAAATEGQGNTPPAATKGQGNAAPPAETDLATLARQFEADGARLLKGARNLLDIAIDRAPASLIVTGNLKAGYSAKPRVAADLPLVSDTDAAAWVDSVYWEVARDTAPGLLIAAPVRDPNAGPTPPGANATPAPVLFSCDASLADPLYESQVAVVRGLNDARRSAEIPLVSPGNFYLRATALGKGGVPLARKTVLFEVIPAELRGELIVTGGEIDTTLGQRVVVQVNPPDTPNPDGTLTSYIPLVTLYRSGRFRSQLCGALSQSMLKSDKPPPVLVAPQTGARDLRASALFFPSARPGQSEIVTSQTVTGGYVEPGVFGLSEPLEIVLKQAGAVSITVESFDASGRKVAVDDSRIRAGETTVAGPGPVPLDLIEGTELTGLAALEVLGGRVEGQSDPLIFSVKEHSDGVTLRVDLDAYARGNLQILGRFVLPDDLQALGGIGGGRVWSNLLPDSGDEVIGARFGFDNADPVALANGLALDAVLHASDERQTLLAATLPRLESLPGGKVLQLDDLEVRLYRTPPVEITARVVDWTGYGIGADPAVSVTLDGQPLTRAGARFVTDLSFTGAAQKKVLRAEYRLASGTVTAETEISAADLGDLQNPQSPGVYELRLPVYVPGSLRLTGTAQPEQSTDSTASLPLDYGVGFAGGDVLDPWTGTVGERFVFDLSFPVRPGDRMQVTARARDGPDTYTATLRAPAPDRATARPAVLDMGAMRLQRKRDLVEVPDLIGMDVDEAQARFAGDFTFRVHRGKDAPTGNAANTIYAQAPLPHSASKPSRVPRGLVLNVAAYRARERLMLNDYRGQNALAAQSALIGLGVANVSVLPGGPAPEGETPGLVIRQTPPGGTLVDPATQQIVLIQSGPPDKTAQTKQPDPEPEPDDREPPPEPEPETPPAPPPEGEFSITGGWVGTFRLDYLKAKAKSEDSAIDVECAAADPCVEQFGTFFTDFLLRLIQKQKAADMGLDLGGAIGDAIGDGLELTVIILAASMAPPVIDTAFEGVEYGFWLKPAADGRPELWVTEDQPVRGEVLSTAALLPTASGGLTVELIDYPNPEGEGTVTLIGSFEPTETGAALSVEISARAPTLTGEFRIRLSGEFTPGTPDPKAMQAAISDKFVQSMETALLKYSGYYQRLKEITDSIPDL